MRENYHFDYLIENWVRYNLSRQIKKRKLTGFKMK